VNSRADILKGLLITRGSDCSIVNGLHILTFRDIMALALARAFSNYILCRCHH